MKIFLLLFFLIVNLTVYGQEMPPIAQFSSEDYGGDNQNWMLSQAPNNFIYVANNRGLLEFNGASWTLYDSPNNTIMRAVHVVEDRIYTGCYAEFGYWMTNQFGVLEYTSLLPQLKSRKVEDEQVWNIINYDVWVLFQTNDHIYFYNTETEKFKTIEVQNIIYKLFKVNNRIYFHVANEGLYRIDAGQPKLIAAGDIVEKGRIVNVFEEDNQLSIITRNQGFFSINNGKLKKWNIEADQILNGTSVFTGIKLKDGSYMVGTISNGLLHVTKEGALDYQITQKRGLSNNTVLSLFEDNAQNVWAGLDNGIDCVNAKSAIKTLYDYEGVMGTVYASQVFKDVLYIGTNQGLFYRKLEDRNADFKPIEGTEGQVWSLYKYNDSTLFCGHHLGTFVIEGAKAQQISTVLGTWDFKTIPNDPRLILQGNYSGLNILQNIDGKWQLRNKIEGFKNSSRYFTIDTANQAWVNHEYKGVFRLKLNQQFTEVTELNMEKALPVGKNSSLVAYNNKIVFASEDGVFKSDDKSASFERDSILSTLFTGDNYISGKLIVDETNKLWAFTKANIIYITTDDVSNKPKVNTISIPSYLRKGPLGYENISLIKEDRYLLGTANGYITIDLSQIASTELYQIYLNSITLLGQDEQNQLLDVNAEVELAYKKGIINFEYSVPEFDKFLEVKYQYRLIGLTEKWSKWSNEHRASFENLSYGNYTFEVRALIGNEPSQNLESYSFTINRPWYLSNMAVVFYVLILVFLGVITHKTYKRYYHKKMKHEQLENEQTIMKIKNEKLNQDIESKNRELAISTMSIIKKNEVLNSIKKELKKSRATSEISSAVELIDKNLNTTKDWQFFEQAFNNADKDFLDKLKQAHPNLTPNDLRFCAYLRLNLSSKEIAPLLNISTKSVETKRYRLRKRLQLEHDEGLVEYILNF
ncbi:regulatory LuxR family protein [Gelidibacter sediminis]|uniref:Regulatory LuxR family protein n=1 Tax=Gelidibacter sediminis TaxID=1608710 RepID=A0A4R7PX81_9FLAO|nr:triple tyrosine motif-containing protein [Gelidibacter sediminis]TDU39555.1 regulatory LuxR family protein [Gelidibacter sediminis]